MSMQRYEPAAHRRGPPKRRAPSLKTLSPRLRCVLVAAVSLGGEVAKMGQALHITPKMLARQVAALRRLGLAQTVTLYDPHWGGRDLEYVTLVRLTVQSPKAMDAFEAWCCEDPDVTCATYISGRFDYRLASLHPDQRVADRWRRVLESREEVGRVEQRQVRTLCGHQLAGIPLVRS